MIKAQCAVFRYLAANREKLAAEGLDVVNTARVGGERWRALSEEEKEVSSSPNLFHSGTTTYRTMNSLGEPKARSRGLSFTGSGILLSEPTLFHTA